MAKSLVVAETANISTINNCRYTKMGLRIIDSRGNRMAKPNNVTTVFLANPKFQGFFTPWNAPEPSISALITGESVIVVARRI